MDHTFLYLSRTFLDAAGGFLMSFMFNPYPYDDPNAINHICFADEKKKQVTANSLATAKAG